MKLHAAGKAFGTGSEIAGSRHGLDAGWGGNAKSEASTRNAAVHGRRQPCAWAASLPPEIGRGFAQEGLRARSDGFFGKNAR